MLRRQREYEEITAFLRALRAANFDLGDREDHDDERLLTKALQQLRDEVVRRATRRDRCIKIARWLAAGLGGAAVTLFGPDAHQWVISHWPSSGR